MRVATVNIASGRDRRGRSADAAGLAAAVAGLTVDVLAVQELDIGQPRSHHVDQPAVLTAAFGAPAWRDVATVAGTPDPPASWRPLVPPTLRGPDDDRSGPRYGIGLFCRRPVRRWHVLGLPPGRARLPVPGPRTQQPRGPAGRARGEGIAAGPGADVPRRPASAAGRPPAGTGPAQRARPGDPRTRDR